MGYHHTLGFASGAGGIDHIGQILWSDPVHRVRITAVVRTVERKAGQARRYDKVSGLSLPACSCPMATMWQVLIQTNEERVRSR